MRHRLVLAGILVLLFVLAASPGVAADRLDSLRAAYSQIDSVHLVAEWDLLFTAPDGSGEVAGQVVLEYWADGARYRIETRGGGDLPIAANLTLAFDGDLFQVFQPDESVLHLETGDRASTPIPVPNPLFLPVTFLSREFSGCEDCLPRLADFDRPGFWQVPESARWLDTKRGTATLSAPSGARPGWSMGFERSPNGLRPQQILERSVAASQVGEITFDAYHPTHHFIPVRITLRVRDQGDLSQILVRGDGRVTKVSINEELAGEIFRLDPDAAEVVWDGDRKEFLKGRRRGSG